MKIIWSIFTISTMVFQFLSCTSPMHGGSYDRPQNKPPENITKWECVDNTTRAYEVYRNDVCDNEVNHPRTISLKLYKVTSEQLNADKITYNNLCKGMTVSEFESRRNYCTSFLQDVYQLWSRATDLNTGTDCGITDANDLAAKLICKNSGGSYNQQCNGLEEDNCFYIDACHIGKTVEGNVAGFYTCSSDEGTTQFTDVVDIINCTEYSSEAMDLCNTIRDKSFLEWANYDTTTQTITYNDCEAEYKEGICQKLSAPDSVYLFNRIGEPIQSYYAACTTRTIYAHDHLLNATGNNQPDSIQNTVSTTFINYTHRKYIDLLPDCPKSQTLMADHVDKFGDTSWVTPIEPLPCNAVLMCKSTRDSIDYANKVKSEEDRCKDPTTGCNLFRLEGLEYLGEDKVYPRLAINYGDTGVAQKGPLYHKVVIPRNKPWKIMVKLRLGYMLADVKDLASIVVSGNFSFTTHSSQGSVDSVISRKDSVLVVTGNLSRQDDGDLLWIDTLDYGTAPNTLGIIGGSLSFKLKNLGGIWADQQLRTTGDTVYITYGLPEQSAYIHSNYIDASIVVLDSVDFDSAAYEVAPMPQYAVENNATDKRLNKVLGIITDEFISNQDQAGGLLELVKTLHPPTIWKVSTICVFDTLKRVISNDSVAYEVVRNVINPWYNSPSRIWKQLDQDGMHGHCQEFSFLLDNAARLIGLQKSLTFRPVQLTAKKDSCVGVKEYSITNPSIPWFSSFNYNPRGYWTFISGQSGQAYFNSVLATESSGYSMLFIGYSSLEFDTKKVLLNILVSLA